MERSIVITVYANNNGETLFVTLKPKVKHSTILEDYIMSRKCFIRKLSNIPFKQYLYIIDNQDGGGYAASHTQVSLYLQIDEETRIKI